MLFAWLSCQLIKRRILMENWIVCLICLVWIGIGAWACLYSNESKATRLLGIITLILGMKILSYTL